MGQTPTDEELFQMINDVDDNASGSIGMLIFFYSFFFSHVRRNLFLSSRSDFTEFLKVVEKQKERAAKFDDESDIRTFFFLTYICSHHIRTLIDPQIYSRRVRGLRRKF